MISFISKTTLSKNLPILFSTLQNISKDIQANSCEIESLLDSANTLFLSQDDLNFYTFELNNLLHSNKHLTSTINEIFNLLEHLNIFLHS